MSPEFDWSQLSFTNSEHPDFLNYLNIEKMRTVETVIPFHVSFPIVGIDPGRNFGITIITPHENESLVYTTSGTMPKGDWNSYGECAFDIGSDLSAFMAATLRSNAHYRIEGASYGALAGQVGLSQVRFGFYLGIWNFSGHQPIIIPPATARKQSFGNGNTKAWELWPDINQNGADSIGIALSGLLG